MGILTTHNLRLWNNQYSKTRMEKQETNNDHLSSTGLVTLSVCFYMGSPTDARYYAGTHWNPEWS
jgi:hypothetical protein